MLSSFYSSEINHLYVKKFIIPNNLKIEYFVVETQRILLLSSCNSNEILYSLIPNNLNFFFKKNILYLYISPLNTNKSLVFKFIFNLKSFLRKLEKDLFKSILIRNSSYKISFSEDSLDILKLKLGYSHLNYLIIPKFICVKIFKKKMLVKSFNKTILGNFANAVAKLRPINMFTGKGLLIKTRKKFKVKEYSKKI